MQNHTFVIPAYKDSPYLESCIKSLINQSIKSEILIATSTPSLYLEQIAKKYNLAYFINSAPSAIASDWNFAIDKAKNTLITIAHQDDIYEPNYAETILKTIEKNKKENILIVFTNYADLINDKARSFSTNAFIKGILLFPFKFSSIIKNKFLKRFVLMFGDPICCPTVTINLNAIKYQFRFSNNYSCALDWLAWLDLAKEDGAFLYIDKKLVNHRIHPESETTNQINNGRRQQEELQIFELLWGKTIAKLMVKAYKLGHKDNRI